MHFNNGWRYYPYLPYIGPKYNFKHIRLHHIIVTTKNQREIFVRIYPLKKFTVDTPTFRVLVGECVRIAGKQFTFQNKYLGNWTTKILNKSKIHLTDPIS